MPAATDTARAPRAASADDRQPPLRVARASAAVGCALLAATCFALAPSRATADAAGDRTAADRPRVALIEENDAFAIPRSDRWYTQGLELHWLSAAAGADGMTSPPGERRFEWFIGQQLFTPADLARYPPDAADRPYAAWLYAGFGLLRERDGRELEHLELELGAVGPAALGRQTQRAFHALSGQIEPRGWDQQLHNEPGIVLSYERQWRVALGREAAVGFELIPELGASAGNVYDYAEAGLLLRFGRGLSADYGAMRLRPAGSGSAWFDARRLDSGAAWSLFAGAQGRGVARNLFLDGNTWRASASVERRPFVGDFTAGASWTWARRWRIDLGWVWRTREFSGQALIDRFGSVTLSAGW